MCVKNVFFTFMVSTLRIVCFFSRHKVHEKFEDSRFLKNTCIISKVHSCQATDKAVFLIS